MKKYWTTAERKWLRERYMEKDVSVLELTELFNEKFHQNVRYGQMKGQIRGMAAKRYTPEQIEWLMNYKGKNMEYMFNKTFGTYRTNQALRQKKMMLMHALRKQEVLSDG